MSWRIMGFQLGWLEIQVAHWSFSSTDLFNIPTEYHTSTVGVAQRKNRHTEGQRGAGA